MIPLYGIVLAGGLSRRMGKDKALLEINGVSQLSRTMKLLENVCEHSFVSVSTLESVGPRAQYPQIADQFAGQGPVDGIASAQQKNPNVAWLVVACDLPLLDLATLQFLIDHRSCEHEVTAFISASDNQSEPLCAIYEPASAAKIRQNLEKGTRSARKVVMDLNHCLIDPPEGPALVNTNTPQQWRSIKQDS
ncbi:MAG: molybdenum cofactor guanylyltransferase [Lysobacterales bacterium]